MKKIIIMFLALVMLLTSTATSFAYKEASGIELDGKNLKLDVKPIIEDGRVLVPARALMEKLGLEVSWDNETQTVVGENNKTKIQLRVGEEYNHKYNNIELGLDVPLRIIKERTLVPVRIIAELLGLEVSWDPNKSRVILNTTNNKPEVSLVDAHNILIKQVGNNPDESFIYMPFTAYASSSKDVSDSSYIFSVKMIESVEGKEYNYMSEFNYCIKKRTGDIYEYLPNGKYYYSSKNHK